MAMRASWSGSSMPDSTNTKTSEEISPSSRPPGTFEHDVIALFRDVGGSISRSVDEFPSLSLDMAKHLLGIIG